MKGVVIVPDLPVDYIEIEDAVLVNAEYFINWVSS